MFDNILNFPPCCFVAECGGSLLSMDSSNCVLVVVVSLVIKFCIHDSALLFSLEYSAY
jgi:hypothetical protein